MARPAKKREQSMSSSEMSSATAQSGGQGHAAAAPQSSAEDAVALLKADHRKVEEIFQRFKSASSADEKKKFAEQACTELTVHTILEEEIFYPACREAQVESEALDEAQVEHDGLKVMIAGIEAAPPDDEFYDAKVTVLSVYVKHHVGEEEKDGGIFSKAQEADMDLKQLGARIRTRKQALMAQGTTPPPPRIRSFDINDVSRANTPEERHMNRRYERPRDDQGRFESDDRGYRSRSSSYSRGRGEDDYEERRSGGGRGWYGDPERHSRASEEGWEHRGGGPQRGYSSRSDREDDDNGRFYGRYSGEGRGWYGDPERHSRASEEGWEHRGGPRRDYSSRSDRDEDDNGRSSGRYSGQGRGWYGDSEGHSRASEEGWEHRGGSRRGYSSRSDRDEDDDGRFSGRGHGGWFGDPEGHSEAARQRSRR